MKKGIGCLLALLAVAGLAAYLARGEIARWWLSRGFDQPKIDAWAHTDFPTGAGTVGQWDLPYRTGRVVIVVAPVTSADIGGKYDDEIVEPARLDDAWFVLDDDIRARTPEEVSTVIVIRRRDGKITLRVFDLKNRILSGATEIQQFNSREELAGYVKLMPVR